MTLDFHDDGLVTGLTHGEFPVEAIGDAVKTRYSHILPKSAPLRLAFNVFRHVFGERGRAAQWTRSWACAWTVRLASAPNVVLFESSDREACVEFEKSTFDTSK